MCDETTERLANALMMGFCRRTGAEFDTIAQPGTSLVPEADVRAGTGQVAWYRLDGPHRFLWADPAWAEWAQGLVDDTVGLSVEDFTEAITVAGGTLLGGGLMRVPRVGAAGSGVAPGPAPAGYRVEALDPCRPDHAARIGAFVAGCDPTEVELAALEDMGRDDTHVRVLCPTGDPERVVAYASSQAWDWDCAPVTFGDVGVLVDPGHRNLGLGRHVVHQACAAMAADGLTPLYRHEKSNQGSGHLAAGLGFHPVVEVWVWALNN